MWPARSACAGGGTRPRPRRGGRPRCSSTAVPAGPPSPAWAGRAADDAAAVAAAPVVVAVAVAAVVIAAFEIAVAVALTTLAGGASH